MTTNISDDMLDALLGNAKTQNDLFGQDGLLKRKPPIIPCGHEGFIVLRQQATPVAL